MRFDMVALVSLLSVESPAWRHHGSQANPILDPEALRLGRLAILPATQQRDARVHRNSRLVRYSYTTTRVQRGAPPSNQITQKSKSPKRRFPASSPASA
jgi:hypothetical protein